jgi:hypothetical protein
MYVRNSGSSFGIKGAFYNARAAVDDTARCNPFDTSIEETVSGIVATLPDLDTSIKFAALCNELECGDFNGQQQVEAVFEFADMTARHE